MAGEPAATYGDSHTAVATGEGKTGKLNATALGDKFGLNPQQINRILFDLKWTERDGKGWKPSSQGLKLQAERYIFSKTLVPYVRWPEDICKSRVLQNAVSEFLSVETLAKPTQAVETLPEDAADKPEGFRERFPPTIRASDGHMVRSRAEALIDGWLYENRVVHAYEKLVRVDQKMYCDFYLPELDVYIEFWGMEGNSKYRARKEVKLDIYRQNELRLIEVKDHHIENLDDYLTEALAKFGCFAK